MQISRKLYIIQKSISSNTCALSRKIFYNDGEGVLEMSRSLFFFFNGTICFHLVMFINHGSKLLTYKMLVSKSHLGSLIPI